MKKKFYNILNKCVFLYYQNKQRNFRKCLGKNYSFNLRLLKTILQ